MLYLSFFSVFFWPAKETFDDYLDKHYNLDFEDVVDGHPCRFRYKKVVPADYGLTTDEVRFIIKLIFLHFWNLQ